MKYRKLGKSDIELSVVALGAWAIGGGTWWGDSDDNQSINAIHAAIDNGVNLIDTAPVYGFGHSESVVGKAIKGKRDKVFIATKCGLWWQNNTGTFHFNLDGKTINRSLAPATIVKELEMSLKRMQIDYIDLYQTHWPSNEPEKYTISDTMECLMKLKEQGKIRSIGASNVTVDDIKQYEACGVLDAIQPYYSMLDRQIENHILPYCIENNISTLAYSPLGRGLLTGKFDMNYEVEKNSARSRNVWFKKNNRQKVLTMLAGWKDLTGKYNCTLTQLVIAWTVAQKGITYALCGARKPGHVLENVKAGDITPDETDISRMRKELIELGEPA